MKFEFFDVTADIGIRAWGESLDEAFENVALALFEVITDTQGVKQDKTKAISIQSEDKKALLYDWLSELIFLHETECIVFSKFKVQISKKSEEYHLQALAWGEDFRPDVHEIRDEVKAITYHLMEIKKNTNYRLQVIIDV